MVSKINELLADWRVMIALWLVLVGNYVFAYNFGFQTAQKSGLYARRSIARQQVQNDMLRVKKALYEKK